MEVDDHGALEQSPVDLMSNLTVTMKAGKAGRQRTDGIENPRREKYLLQLKQQEPKCCKTVVSVKSLLQLK